MSIPPSTSTDYRQEIISRLEHQNDKLRLVERLFSNYALLVDDLANARLHSGRNRTMSSGNTSSEVLILREEMSLLYRQKNKNDQDLIEANRKLSESQIVLAQIVEDRDKLQADHSKLCARIADLEVVLSKTKEEKATLYDEWIALLAVSRTQKEKILGLENEQIRLINKIKELNEQKAMRMNEEIENQAALQQRRIQEDIARAIAEPVKEERTRTLSTNSIPSDFALGDVIPGRLTSRTEVNDGEVLDVLWLTPEVFATAGVDKFVKLYRMDGNGKPNRLCTLSGSNLATTRLDYAADSKSILASSNDHNIRLWNIETQQSKCTFSGHSDKVLSARFHQSHQFVSGSYDRSIKVWDLRYQKILTSYFPGSAVHDVCGNMFNGGSSFLSGHFDKKIRLWDGRDSQPCNVVEMGGKITSLDIASDGYSVLCSSRDDTLSLIDVRNFRIVHSYSAEQYHTASDFSRCSISPSMEYCVAGSSNGAVFIWNLHSTKLEKCLVRGHDHPVLSVNWNISGKGILSSDRQRNVVYWL